MYWKRDNAKGWMDFGKKKYTSHVRRFLKTEGFQKGKSNNNKKILVLI